MDDDSEDPIHAFLLKAHTIVTEARFIVSSLPNVEPFSVERSLRLLSAVHHILSNIDDPFLPAAEIEGYQSLVIDTARPLAEFQEAPPPPRNIGTSRIYTGRPGRPRYVINLQRVVELHNLGSTWESIADAEGVSERSLYRHLERAGISIDRPSFTEISDDDLDAIVSGISARHPLAGSAIMLGHLEAQGIHVPVLRVQESLRRVDGLGVFVR